VALPPLANYMGAFCSSTKKRCAVAAAGTVLLVAALVGEAVLSLASGAEADGERHHRPRRFCQHYGRSEATE